MNMKAYYFAYREFFFQEFWYLRAKLWWFLLLDWWPDSLNLAVLEEFRLDDYKPHVAVREMMTWL